MLLFNYSKLAEMLQLPEFQNILRYCLTLSNSETLEEYFSFQNILCYCLTDTWSCRQQSTRKFQNILCYCLTQIVIWTTCGNFISKHPMLLFNFDVLLICSLTSEFQNILCYCLTIHEVICIRTCTCLLYTSPSPRD